MARRRKRRNSSAQVDPDLRDVRREKEILSRAVDPNSSLMKAVMEELPDASNVEALRIALALQKEIRGKASLLSRPEASAEVNRLFAQAEKMDKASEQYETDRVRFVEDVLERANHLTGERLEREKAKGMEVFKTMRAKTAAENSVKRLEFMARLNAEPKETVLIPGVERMVKVGGALRRILEPEVVRIMDVEYVLTPGSHEVPRTIANALRERRKSQLENEERKKAMSAYKDIHTLQKTLDSIGEQFGSGGEKLIINS